MKIIPLSKNLCAKVDDLDFDFLARRNWFALEKESGGKSFFVAATGSRHELMHRAIMKPAQGLVVDHINGDTLDNRRSNLRVCTKKENFRNSAKRLGYSTSPYKGVSFTGVVEGKSWRSRIRVDGKLISLGAFSDEEEAARAYDSAARKYFGEFARTNFLIPLAT